MRDVLIDSAHLVLAFMFGGTVAALAVGVLGSGVRRELEQAADAALRLRDLALRERDDFAQQTQDEVARRWDAERQRDRLAAWYLEDFERSVGGS